MTQDSALIFPFLNKSDSGTYGCTAISNLGSYKAYYTLNVNGEPPPFPPTALSLLLCPPYTLIFLSPESTPDGALEWTRGTTAPHWGPEDSAADPLWNVQ